jgi:deoxyadenosine/deoxycytidine kinase/NTP pyrophosphatase (non-canonical NTP hydrolase)
LVFHPYIAIEGAIGVGKTTLARILGEVLPSEVLLEVFEENPFLNDFYADRQRYAFQTQIFFLMSRYRQQHKVIGKTLRHSALVSDYLFAKDWLFAHLNLGGDELAMYERVHAILGEQIPAPALVIYLRASIDALMDRIRYRGRSYERQMERGYIEALQGAYDRFFAEFDDAPVLVIDTDGLDIVNDLEARAQVVNRVKAALQGDSLQLPLLDLDETGEDAPAALSNPRRRLADFQRFHRALDREKGFIADLFFDYICLTEEIGEIGRVIKQTWRTQDALVPQTGNRQEAMDRALESAKADLQEELADALAYLLKIANDSGIDLEAAYLAKMDRNLTRTWPNP